MTIDQAISKAVQYLQQGVAIAVLIIFAVTILDHFGLRIPAIKPMSAINLLYIAGAYALITGRVKIG